MVRPQIQEEIKEVIRKGIENQEDKTAWLVALRTWLHEELSEHPQQPIDNVLWVPVEKVQANDYNPNSVAKNEMKLLYTSISHDGYTQPVVTIYDEEFDKYVIVDGFHRYTTLRTNQDLYETNKGLLPIVVLKKDINERMAATVRHNRARGKHSVAGMGQIVFNMLQNGVSDVDILAELGLEAEELVRLKHITGFSKLFAEAEYGKSWETDKQIKIRKEYLKENPNESAI